MKIVTTLLTKFSISTQRALPSANPLRKPGPLRVKSEDSLTSGYLHLVSGSPPAYPLTPRPHRLLIEWPVEDSTEKLIEWAAEESKEQLTQRPTRKVKEKLAEQAYNTDVVEFAKSVDEITRIHSILSARVETLTAKQQGRKEKTKPRTEERQVHWASSSSVYFRADDPPASISPFWSPDQTLTAWLGEHTPDAREAQLDQDIADGMRQERKETRRLTTPHASTSSAFRHSVIYASLRPRVRAALSRASVTAFLTAGLDIAAMERIAQSKWVEMAEFAALEREVGCVHQMMTTSRREQEQHRRQKQQQQKQYIESLESRAVELQR